MKYRLGTCSDCGASYKVPASFESDRAKCKSCGGVVEIGAVREDAPDPGPAAAPPMPARKVAPKSEAGAAKPTGTQPAKASGGSGSKSERKGPSMKERLLAERRAEAEAAAGPQDASGSRPPRKPAAARTGATKKSGAANERPAAARGRDGDDAPTRAGARSGRGGSRGASRRSAPARGRRGGRGRAGDDDAEETGGRGSRRGGGRRPREGQQNPVLMIVAGVLLVLAVGAGWFLFQGRDAGEGDGVMAGGQDTAAETGDEVAADGGASDAATDTGTGDVTDETTGLLDEDGGDEGPESEGSGDAAAGDDGAAATAANGAVATDVTDEESSGAAESVDAEKPKKKPTDPATIDLTALEDFDRPNGCSEERWAELQELAATLCDPFAGAAGGRAGKKLVEEGKFAIPAILNEMKDLDLADRDQFLTANLAQKKLEEICNGKNLGWQHPDSHPETWLVYDKRVIQRWFQDEKNLWPRMNEDHEYWLKFTGRDEGEQDDSPGDEGEIEAPEVGGEDDLDALDDI